MYPFWNCILTFRQEFEGVLIFVKFCEDKAESWMLLTVSVGEWLEYGDLAIDIST